MTKHVCDAIIITCIDFRIQKYIDKWLNKYFKNQKFDRVALAGGVFDFYSILRQVEISSNLHEIKRVVLINHEDCGAYGKEGNYSRHVTDLIEAKRKIEAIFPHLDVEVYYLYLNGRFEEVFQTNPGFKH